MSKTKKPISHYEYTHTEHKERGVFKPSVRYTFSKQQFVDEKTGRISFKIVKKLVNESPYKHMKPSDFALENMLAVGATLAPCSLRHDVHTSISNIEASLSSLSHNLDNGK